MKTGLPLKNTTEETGKRGWCDDNHNNNKLKKEGKTMILYEFLREYKKDKIGILNGKKGS